MIKQLFIKSHIKQAGPAGTLVMSLRLQHLAVVGGVLVFASLAAVAAGQLPAPAAVSPAFHVTPALNGAVIVDFVPKTRDAKVYYTLDGSIPTTSSQQFLAPFLVDSKEVIKAIAVTADQKRSTIAKQEFAPEVAVGTLVWSDEFTKSAGTTAPNPEIWTYDTGASGFGNSELENYCAAGSTISPCSASSPNAYVTDDGYLHITANQPTPGVYTSARMKTQGLFSFRYGRIEFRAKVPEAQGLWPAAWLLGDTVSTAGWPACGEQDVLERVDAAKDPDWNQGSVHGPGFTGTPMGTTFHFPAAVTASSWHTYGTVWKPGSVSFYVDDPSTPYATYRPDDLKQYAGAKWPFDGPANFILLNLAVGGQWPGDPKASTAFPAELLVDYVRIYKN